MKKKTAIWIKIIVLGILTLALIGILIVGILGNTFRNFPIFGSFSSYDNADLYQVGNADISASELSSLSIDWVSGSVKVDVYDGNVIGYLGEVHPTVCENYDMKTRAYIAVIDMPYVYEMSSFDKKYEGIAKFPAVTRDISMVVPKNILVGQIEEVIEKSGGKNLESYSLFDIYEGDQIEEGFKSVAYSIVFRAKDRTLEENDVSSAMKKILKGLEEMGIQLRG